MEPTTIDLSWLCFVLPLGLIIVAAVLGTRSRRRYASRIREARAKGAFADMDTPAVKSRYRRFAALSVFGSLGVMISGVIFFYQRANGIILPGATVIAMMIFCMIAIIGGFLMKREIDRRL